MAFIIVSNKGAEVCRQELVGGLTLGRAPDCGLSVHDILLSRHHCRIEPSGRGWVVIDLRSKNGTWLEGERVGRRSLRDGEVVRAGNTSVRFMIGPMPVIPPGLPSPRKQRPADPVEALTGTVFDFDSREIDDEPELQRSRPRNGAPYPQPVPRDPISYARDGVYSLLEEIASSSWDSIYANASRPTGLAATGAELAVNRAPAVRQQAHSTGLSDSISSRRGNSSRPGAAGASGSPQADGTHTTENAASEKVRGVRSVSRLESPARGCTNHAAAPDTLPVPSRSRLQVDISLQAPVVRVPRSNRAPAPSPGSTHSVRTRSAPKEIGPARSVTRRAWRTVTQTLASIHRRIASRRSIMLV